MIFVYICVTTTILTLVNVWQKNQINVGAALQELDEPPQHFAVRGRDLMSGIPKEIIVTTKKLPAP